MKNFSMTLCKPLFASFMLHRCTGNVPFDTTHLFILTSKTLFSGPPAQRARSEIIGPDMKTIRSIDGIKKELNQ